MKFRFVDKIIKWEPFHSIHGRKAVSFEEYCLKSPFGGSEALPESILLGAGIELVTWLCILSTQYHKGMLVQEIGASEFYSQLHPGQVVDMDGLIHERLNDLVLFDLSGLVAGKQLFVSRGCRGRLVDLVETHDPDDLQTLFSEISSQIAIQ